MKFFVTGATGFIGSHFIDPSIEAGHELIALRRPQSCPRITCRGEPRWLEKPMDEIETGDFGGVDVLVHLASVGVSPQVASWEAMFYWNVDVLVRLLGKAAEAGVKRAVILGTFAEYGRSSERYDLIPADAPLLPVAGYPASKAASFVASSAFAVEHGLDYAYLRLFSVFGEGQHEKNFWPALRRAALSGADFPMTLGEQIRDYVPVESVVTDILKYATIKSGDGPLHLVRNIGSGNPVTMRSFAEGWWQKWNAAGVLLPGMMPYRSNEPMRYVPEIIVD